MIKYLNWFATAVGYVVIAYAGHSTYEARFTIAELAFPTKPIFKVGDCIRSFDSFDHIIIEIIPGRGMQNNMYGYTVGLDCTGPDYYNHCSTSVGDIKVVNESSVKIDCPK